MKSRHDTLRDELMAVLSAGRELPADADGQLADAFMRYMEAQEDRQSEVSSAVEMPHQPHYSLKIAGGVWGAALMFLFLLLLLNAPNPVVFIVVSVGLLSLVGAVTRAFLYLARYGWQLPRVKLLPPVEKPQSRG